MSADGTVFREEVSWFVIPFCFKKFLNFWFYVLQFQRLMRALYDSLEREGELQRQVWDHIINIYLSLINVSFVLCSLEEQKRR